MTPIATSKITKKQILAAKTSQIRSLNNEKALKYELSKFFQKLKEKVLAELEVYYNPDFMFEAQGDLILASVHEAHREYYSILEKYNKKEYQAGVREARRLTRLARQRHRRETKRIKKSLADKSENNSTTIKAEDLFHTTINKDKLFATSPWTEQRLLNKSFVASENTMKRVDGSINKILTEGYQSGKGIKSVRNDLVKRFDQLKDWEANRIARTEIHNAHQMGIMNEYNESGVEYTQWSSAQDDRVRGLKPSDSADHVALDGEIIALGDTFSNGLGYPGDTSGPIEEWINCRCANIPFIMPYGYTAPTFSPFRESDIIPTLDLYDNTDYLGQLAESATQEASQTTNPQGHQVTPDELKPAKIDTSILSKETEGYWEDWYYIDSEYEGFTYNQQTGKAHYKGLEVKDYDPAYDMGYIDPFEISKHNEQFEVHTDVINTSDLIMTGSDGNPGFVVDPGLPGFQLIEGKAYYKGLELKQYDFDKNHGVIYKYEIDNHNQEYILEDTEILPLNKVEEKLSVEDFNDYEDLKDNIEWAITIQSSEYVSKTGKEKALDSLPDWIAELEELNKKVKEADEPAVSGDFINMSELLYDSYFDEYKIPKMDFKYNPKTSKHEYKGLGIDFDQYANSGAMIYIKADDIIKHNEKIAKELKASEEKSDIPEGFITVEDIMELEMDPDGDYMITEDQHVTLNKETGNYEYKGVELTDYDPIERDGYIEGAVINEVMARLEPPAADKYIPDMLTESTNANGEKIVVDPSGREWVIDEIGKYEHAQDQVQHQIQFTDEQRASGAYWGRYGHQMISNLLYGDSRYTDYYQYKDLIDNKISPLLNKMRDKYKIVVDETLETEVRMKAIEDYQELKAEFEDIANSFDDFAVTKLLYQIMDIDNIIVKSPELMQDTCVVRYGRFDESMCIVGETFIFDGFLSTSYDDVTSRPDATSHFADKPNRWKIIVLAPEGTSGTRLNDQFNALTTEREWLLERQQEFEVLWHGKTTDPTHPDGVRNTVVIRLPG